MSSKTWLRAAPVWFLLIVLMAARLVAEQSEPRPGLSVPSTPSTPAQGQQAKENQGLANVADCLQEIEDRIVRIRALTKTRIDPKRPGGVVYEYTYGTGVLVNGEGRIVTAFHLVRDRKRSLAGIEEVAIFLRASRSYVPVDVIAEDPISDIAVLRASPRALPYGKFFSIAKGRPLPKVGERSYVIGLRADASEDSFEVGIVGGTFIDAGSRLEELARGKKLGPGPWITVSQMILFGYSGGAIIDGSGELIGIVVGAPELKGKWAEFSYGSGVDAVLRLFAEKEEK